MMKIALITIFLGIFNLVFADFVLTYKMDYDRLEFKYKDISNFGEYRIEFLILLAKLLMIQEKTNMADAFMFRKLLEALKRGEDIFSIVSIASHTGR